MDRILIIIRRSNGDVFLASPLIDTFKIHYPNAKIDILVNQETLGIAKTLANVNKILVYNYDWKSKGILFYIKKEFDLIRSIRSNYDLSINLTSNDRNILYAKLASKKAISCIENESKKSWWKRLLLDDYYFVDPQRHIVEHNLIPLSLLGLEIKHKAVHAHVPRDGVEELNRIPFDLSKPFIIFHPVAQYRYKIYPRILRDRLLALLNTLEIPIVVTGGPSLLDREISQELPQLKNLYNLIGKTSLAGYIALCEKSRAYIGMDTLNMHIAAALDKPVFAIFGPTLPQIWSPWCNQLQRGTSRNAPVQSYGNITLFQADMPCVACGKAGCNDQNGVSECLSDIDPLLIFNEVKKCLNRSA
jgi:heptosyltransferase-3